MPRRNSLRKKKNRFLKNKKMRKEVRKEVRSLEHNWAGGESEACPIL